MGEASGIARGFTLLGALILHVAAGVGGVALYYWRTGNDPIFSWGNTPHPLQSWRLTAIAGWIVTGLLIVWLTTWQANPWKRFAAQLLIPVFVLAAWAGIVFAVDDYPLNLRAEWDGSGWSVDRTELRPGYQRLGFANNTPVQQTLRILILDEPSPPPKPAGGETTGQILTGTSIQLTEAACFILACSDPTVETLGPFEKSTVAVNLSPGSYAVVCAEDIGEVQIPVFFTTGFNCQPGYFTVSADSVG